jgi:hypothetical protein
MPAGLSHTGGGKRDRLQRSVIADEAPAGRVPRNPR